MHIHNASAPNRIHVLIKYLFVCRLYLMCDQQDNNIQMNDSIQQLPKRRSRNFYRRRPGAKILFFSRSMNFYW